VTAAPPDRNIDLIASGLARRFGRSPDEFEMRVFAGAVTGAQHASIDDTRDYSRSIEAIDFLERGMPLL